MRKYFKHKQEAIAECKNRNMDKGVQLYNVFKMPKGTRHHGEYAVCSEMDYLNTY